MNLRQVIGWISAMLWLFATPAGAQDTTAPAASATRPWIVIGATSTTMLGDCTDCEGNPYRHTGSFLANAGWSLNDRADVGAEILSLSSHTSSADRIRVNFLMASVQFRPWRQQGFFVRVGSGMAFVRNWILELDGQDTAFRSKAFALGLTAGWEWRTGEHFGVQVLGAQHVAALGDLQSSTRTMENVMGNFWSAGGAIVIR